MKYIKQTFLSFLLVFTSCTVYADFILGIKEVEVNNKIVGYISLMDKGEGKCSIDLLNDKLEMTQTFTFNSEYFQTLKLKEVAANETGILVRYSDRKNEIFLSFDRTLKKIGELQLDRKNTSHAYLGYENSKTIIPETDGFLIYSLIRTSEKYTNYGYELGRYDNKLKLKVKFRTVEMDPVIRIPIIGMLTKNLFLYSEISSNSTTEKTGTVIVKALNVSGLTKVFDVELNEKEFLIGPATIIYDEKNNEYLAMGQYFVDQKSVFEFNPLGVYIYRLSSSGAILQKKFVDFKTKIWAKNDVLTEKKLAKAYVCSYSILKGGEIFISGNAYTSKINTVESNVFIVQFDEKLEVKEVITMDRKGASSFIAKEILNKGFIQALLANNNVNGLSDLLISRKSEDQTGICYVYLNTGTPNQISQTQAIDIYMYNAKSKKNNFNQISFGQMVDCTRSCFLPGYKFDEITILEVSRKTFTQPIVYTQPLIK